MLNQFKMAKNKVLVLLPDGVGLRNFVFTDFPQLARQNHIALKYWNATNFNLKTLGLDALKLKGQAHFKTDLYKRARKDIEIKNFIKTFGNDIYKQYVFKTKASDFKSIIKYIWLKLIILKYKNNLNQLRHKIKAQERQTEYYKDFRTQLTSEQPDLVFCTNQRPVQAISPIIAAQDLGIPTATFIFSWDNLPKATMVVETDYYFVWSDHMAKQLMAYYPYVQKSQIRITGSPQFELHYKENFQLNKVDFCRAHDLPEDKKFICFSGDDVTTSPHDPVYLNDVCEAIQTLNAEKDEWRIIFRACPVDFSDRYDGVLEKYANLVYPLRPKWEKEGDAWNTVLPTPEDQILLYNSIEYSELIINLGSSMVFDAACHEKPCAYINYNPNVSELKKDVNTVYKYLHFQSMPSKNAVVWLNSKEHIAQNIVEGLKSSETYVKNAKAWLNVICKTPEEEASDRIVKQLKSIIKP
jgi:hypothetical protein